MGSRIKALSPHPQPLHGGAAHGGPGLLLLVPTALVGASATIPFLAEGTGLTSQVGQAGALCSGDGE